MNSRAVLDVSNKGTVPVPNDGGEFSPSSDGNVQQPAGVTLSLQRGGVVATGKWAQSESQSRDTQPTARGVLQPLSAAAKLPTSVDAPEETGQEVHEPTLEEKHTIRAM